MRKSAQILITLGILLLVGGWWVGYRGDMAFAKKQEAKTVKVRLVEGGKREVEGGPVIEVPTVERSDKEWGNRLTIEQLRVGRAHGTERAF